MWQTRNLTYLMREAHVKVARNAETFKGTFNMGPTNFIPAIRSYNRFMTNVQTKSQVE